MLQITSICKYIQGCSKTHHAKQPCKVWSRAATICNAECWRRHNTCHHCKLVKMSPLDAIQCSSVAPCCSALQACSRTRIRTGRQNTHTWGRPQSRCFHICSLQMRDTTPRHCSLLCSGMQNSSHPAQHSFTAPHSLLQQGSAAQPTPCTALHGLCDVRSTIASMSKTCIFQNFAA